MQIVKASHHFMTITRDAVQKMGKDIIACRDYILALKKDNNRLNGVVEKLQEPILDVSLINVPRDNLIKEVLRARRLLREQVFNLLKFTFV